MKQKLICQECQEVIGKIEKDIITEEDRRIYQEGASCSSGHSGSVVCVPDTSL